MVTFGRCHNDGRTDHVAQQGRGEVLPNGNRVSSPAVSWRLCCATQSQVWLPMSSPNALSWNALFCVFPAVLLQALAPSPAAGTAAAGPPRRGTCWPRSLRGGSCGTRLMVRARVFRVPSLGWGHGTSAVPALPWAQPSWPVPGQAIHLSTSSTVVPRAQLCIQRAPHCRESALI